MQMISLNVRIFYENSTTDDSDVVSFNHVENGRQSKDGETELLILMS